MAEKEHTQRCSSNSSGGGGDGGGDNSNRSFKRLKQKKVPQRGLGVALLEKIRLEEQQKKDVILPANRIISTNNSSSLCLAIQPSSFSPNPLIHLPTSTISLPSPSSASTISLPSTNSLFGSVISIPNLDILQPNSVSLPKLLNLGVDQMCLPTVSLPGHENLPKLRNVEFNLEEENHEPRNNGFRLPSNPHFSNESNPPFRPLHITMMQGSQVLQKPSSMVNLLSGTSSSSSVINFQIEPPSNQIYCDQYMPVWLEEEEVVGMKRPYPFSLDKTTAPLWYSSPCVGNATRQSESVSHNNIGSENDEAVKPREETWERVQKKHGNLNGDFLTLAPPTAFLHLNQKRKLSSSYLWTNNKVLSQMESFPHQVGIIEDTISQSGLNGSTQQPFFTFFPSAETQVEEAMRIRNRNGEVVENVDLNLKL